MTDDQALREGWHSLLSPRSWDHLVHLTSRDEISEYRLIRRFRQGFIRSIERRLRRRVDWFAVVEATHPDYPHLHVLLSGTRELDCKDVQQKWREGLSRVCTFHPRQPGLQYILKNVKRGTDSCYLSRRLPDRRDRAELR